MRKHFVLAALAAALLSLAAAAGALGARQVVRAGGLFLADNGGISPRRLPRHGVAPISARLDAEIGTVDGSHPPAVQTLTVDVDRTIQIDAVGLPSCKPQQLAARDPAAARRVCGAAVVGSGRAEVEVAFPEQRPFSAGGPVILFNGGVQGPATHVLVYAYVDVPAPTAIVAPASVTRISRGRFGLEISARIPRIAGGAGSVTGFDLTVGRRFSYRGRRRSFLSAGCPSGHWLTQGEVHFSDGTELGLTHVFPCTPTS